MSSFFSVETDHPVALDSPDHKFPWGTARDNSKNLLFNKKVLELFTFLEQRIKILDLGCSGGAFVKSCLDEGSLAIGIEGSDYSKVHARAEWPLLGDRFLFTADITKEFTVLHSGKKIYFDLITSWEVMEHLPKERLEITCKNIYTHLQDHGLAILSVSSSEEIIRGQKLHLTVQDKSWWIDFFANNNLYHLPKYARFFNSQYIRGPKQNAPGSFHLFLSKYPEKAPPLFSLSLKQKLLDRWHFSKTQKRLKKLLGDFS